MTTYNTNLASEFYVLSMLYRLGVDASLTLGNKKAVDIIVVSDGIILTVDVKGLAKAYDWPADNIRDFTSADHFYALVSFEGKMADYSQVPSVWIIRADALSPFIREYTTRKVISRAEVKSKGTGFYHNWQSIMPEKPG
jgi:hypothetical protein